ncbi:interleukin-1 receptor type 1 isoform X2 [Mugil cephalus]|uniref:interleukin-1 receptor type 1 isoform X2 n=1 Tax=Mugil cephalus TaxID=48193 RepID=UPI001FB7B116|nr:interleukin-1 receptor type 1 isoform X2 [Mugil cephalus]
MDASRLLFHTAVVICISGGISASEPTVSECDPFNTDLRRLLEGEALHFQPYGLSKASDREFTWYKNGSQIWDISSNETERIHYHGKALFFLNVLSDDAGIYFAQQITPSGERYIYCLKLEIFNSSYKGNDILNFGSIKNSDQNKRVPCPEPITTTCTKFKGNFTWYKDLQILPDEHKSDLWVYNTSKTHEGIYTCVCSWTYNHNIYHSSGSRRLIALENSIPNNEIISPTSKEQFVFQGSELKLNCSVFCGTNVKSECSAKWYVKNEELKPTDGYNLTTERVIEDPSKRTISTTILTINKVSPKDFHSEFNCVGETIDKVSTFTLTLKPKEPTVSECDPFNTDLHRLLEGEALHFQLFGLSKASDREFTWYKNGSQIWDISSNETERIHYHGKALFFLNVLSDDAGIYFAQQITPSGERYIYCLKLEIFNSSYKGNDILNFGSIKNSDQNKRVPCPEPITTTCTKFKGNFTWYKDLQLLPDEHKSDLWVHNTSKTHEGIYTCVCSWTYNHNIYHSSGSRRLIALENSIPNNEIISPTSKEQFVFQGSELKLNCSVFCGTNVKSECSAKWYVKNKELKPTDGYNLTTERVIEDPSKRTISTTILTIKKVSPKDFHSEFNCVGETIDKVSTFTLTLKPKESVVPLVIRVVFVLMFFVFATMVIKCFAIDLALFFRAFCQLNRHNKDSRIYDAYVVYQTESMDKATEEKLSEFVTKILPSVLEDKCGYRLFIQGRDDIPGEDRMELVEYSIKQSRRLMVILTPGLGSGTESMFKDQCPTSQETSVIGGFDWQVGLHHALVQREMNVILIQLGEPGPQGYTYLPPGLQHLIRKSAPIRWPEASKSAASWNSRFWKRVRYLMPATPAKKVAHIALI